MNDRLRTDEPVFLLTSEMKKQPAAREDWEPEIVVCLEDETLSPQQRYEQAMGELRRELTRMDAKVQHVLQGMGGHLASVERERDELKAQLEFVVRHGNRLALAAAPAPSFAQRATSISSGRARSGALGEPATQRRHHAFPPARAAA